MPQAATEDTTDVFYGIRGAVGSQENFSVARSDVGYPQHVVQTTLTSAEVLSLNSTPVVIVTGVPDKYIIPRHAILILSTTASINYATNVNIVLGPEDLVSGTNYTMRGTLPTLTTNSVATPGFSFTGQVTSIAEGVGLSAYVLTGNPTAGDGPVIIKVFYELVDA